MSETIKVRVADAIGCIRDDCERFRANGRPRRPPRTPCDDCLWAAECAIDALRVPTEEMKKALTGYAVCSGHIEEGWAAAMDEAAN